MDEGWGSDETHDEPGYKIQGGTHSQEDPTVAGGNGGTTNFLCGSLRMVASGATHPSTHATAQSGIWSRPSHSIRQSKSHSEP